MKAIVLKNIFKKCKYAMYLCNEDKVYYLILKNKKLQWKTLNSLKDCANMIVFDEPYYDTRGAKINNKWINMNPIPKDAEVIEIVKGYPVYENNKIWFDGVSTKIINLKRK